MNCKLLTKFVFMGMKKNKRTLVPYLVAGIITVMIFYILDSLAFCPYIYANHKEAFYGAQTIAILLEMAAQITAFFSFLFIFYANRFGIKSRKKEMALYGVLGMSKKNITMIMFLESLIEAVIAIVSGILAGTFLNKLMLLLLYKIIKQKPVNGMIFSVVGLKDTLLIFGAIFFICLIYNVCSISVGNPIELLHSENIGEKEPKVKIVPLVIGVLALAAGYYSAVSVKSTGEAFSVLLVSILLVIIGTYCLFITGSIFILKVLKNNSKFYYKTKNFISVSNLMFRMKHNAAGLASICVMSTGVIILLTSGFSLMMLGEENINKKFPTDIKVQTASDSGEMESVYTEAVTNAVKKAGIKMKDLYYRQSKTAMAAEKDNKLLKMKLGDMIDLGNSIDLYFVRLEDYNKYAGTDISLGEKEILLYNSKDKSDSDKLDIFGETYTIKGKPDYDTLHYIIDPTMSLFEKEIIVLKDDNEMNLLLNSEEDSDGEENKYNIYIGYDLNKKLSKEQQSVFESSLNESGLEFEISYKETDRGFFYNIYGGAFFVGIFLAILFLMATVLIIYYKQMAEGYEDRHRFEILANVGLTDKEAKTTIKRQVMILFFLPVVASFIHVAVASKVLRLFLRMVLVVDGLTFAISIAIVCVIFLAVYALVYKITSGEYYRIVYGRNM